MAPYLAARIYSGSVHIQQHRAKTQCGYDIEFGTTVFYTGGEEVHSGTRPRTPDNCLRVACDVALFLKKNPQNDRSDYPAPRRYAGGIYAWTGLPIKYGGKVCWFRCKPFRIGEVVWAFRLPGV